jgi:hypothetical protein
MLMVGPLLCWKIPLPCILSRQALLTIAECLSSNPLPKILPKWNKMLGDKVAFKELEEEAKTFN